MTELCMLNFRLISSTVGIMGFVSSIAQQEMWSRDSVSPNTILLGGIRLRQLRVKGQNCTRVYRKLMQEGLLGSFECYPGWENGQEDTEYTKEFGSKPSLIEGLLYGYQSAIDTQENTVSGRFGSYPGSGFVVSLTSNSTDSVKTIETLNQGEWLDFKTRALFVNFVTYNPDLDLFVITRILFEFLPNGVITMSTYVHAFNLDDFRSDGVANYMRIAMTCAIYVIIALKLASLLDEVRKNGLVKFGSAGWHYVQSVNILLFVLSGFVRISNNIINLIAFPDENYDTQSVTSHILRSLNDLSTAIDIQAKVDGLNSFLLWIELGRFLEKLTRHLTRCSSTLANSIADIFTFAFLFSILAFAFAVLGLLFHGNEVEEFSTVWVCADTILRAMYGDVDFGEILWYSGPSGLVFIMVWLLVSSTVLLNMTVGIIIDTYGRVMQEEKDASPGPSLLSTIIKDVRGFFDSDSPNQEKEESAPTQAQAEQSKDNLGSSVWNLSGSDDNDNAHQSDAIGAQLPAASVPIWRPWQDKIFPDAPSEDPSHALAAGEVGSASQELEGVDLGRGPEGDACEALPEGETASRGNREGPAGAHGPTGRVSGGGGEVDAELTIKDLDSEETEADGRDAAQAPARSRRNDR